MAKRDTFFRLLAALFILITGNVAASGSEGSEAACADSLADIPRGQVGISYTPQVFPESGAGDRKTLTDGVFSAEASGTISAKEAFIIENVGLLPQSEESRLRSIRLPSGMSVDFPQKIWSPYMEPYSLRGSKHPNWHRMWINTAVLSGAFVSTLLVLECLPEDATSWNRESIQSRPPLQRWYRNIFVLDPEIDHDNPVFNYILHPYAGAVYFMAARSCGFSFWGSLLYSAAVSTIGWEFGIEACMERPSYQDIVITPVVGSLLGEMFYKCKRHIVEHDYTLWGSRVLGNVVAFLVDPVNEVVNLFRGSYERKLHLGRENPSVVHERPLVSSSFTPTFVGGAPGFTLTCTF